LDCGAVVDRVIYSKPEWRAYSYDDKLKRERAGAPITPLLHDFGLSTHGPRQRISSQSDEFMIKVLSEIYRISSSLNLPESVARTAAMLLRKIDTHFKRSRKLAKALPAALLYLSSRIHGVPRTPKELAQYSRASKSEILTCSMKLASFLKIRNALDIKAYVSRVVNDLKLNGEVEASAITLCKLAHKLGLDQGRNRRAIAAASVYLAAKSTKAKVSQRSLAKAAGVSLSTLKRRIKEIESYLQRLRYKEASENRYEGGNSCHRN